MVNSDDISYKAVKTDSDAHEEYQVNIQKNSGESSEAKIHNQNENRIKLINIVLLGTVFMTTGSRTPISIQKTVLFSAKQINTTSYVEGFNGDGYISNSLLYASFAISNFFAPWMIARIGPKYSMFLGGLGYTVYAAQLLYLSDILLYACAVFNGVGASLLWTGQGTFLSINSSPDSAARDSGIFWTLYQLSGVVGNLAVYILFKGVTIIETDVRLQTAGILTGICILGVLITLAYQPTPWHHSDKKSLSNPVRSLLSCLQLLTTGSVMKLSIAFLYSGLEVSFWAGVLPSCISFTQHLGHQRKSLMGLASIMISIGSMVGGLLLISFKDLVNKRGRNMVIIFGLVVHITAYILSFLYLAHLSPMGDTNQAPYLSPSMAVILVTAILMGLGDAAFNTQIISLISSQFTNNTSQAYALYKLVQSVGVSAGFAVSTRVGLYWQILALGTFASLGSLAFMMVERTCRKS